MITSKKNPIIKDTASLLSKKGRNKEGAFIMEGPDFVSDIPENINVRYFIISKSFSEKNDWEKFQERGKVYLAEDDVFSKCSDTINSKGVICVCDKMGFDLKEVLDGDNNLLLICDEIQDPGNLGTIIRTAESAGVKGILLVDGCCDMYNSKTIRATAGAIFNLPVVEKLNRNELIHELHNNNISLVATSLQCDNYYFDEDYTKSVAVVVGNEGNGIREEFIEKSDKLVKIPMIGKSESLNVAISASIILYEVVKQRFKR